MTDVTGGASKDKAPAIKPGDSPAPDTMGSDPAKDPMGQTAAPAKPTFGWAPDYADFAETMLGDSTASQTVTLTNTSDVDAADVSLDLNGSQFVVGTNECAGTLAAHSSCKVEVSFHPTLAIPAQGLLYLVLGKATQDHVVVHLSGTGKELPPGMSMPTYPPGTYPMCSNPVPPGSDWDCGNSLTGWMKKDGFICGRCLVGSTQACLPAEGGGITLCVLSCSECSY